MGNVLRPARGADDERLFPAGYIESVSSTHTVTITDDFVPFFDSLSTGISVINDIIITDLFTIFSDTSVKSLIKGVGLTDSLIIIDDVVRKKILPTITDISLLADRFPPVSGTTRQVKVEDALVIQDAAHKLNELIFTDNMDIISDTSDAVKTLTSILTDRLEIPEDAFVKCLYPTLSDLILTSDTIVQYGIIKQILTDSIVLSESINKKLDLSFVDQVPIVTDEKTARFHWVCVFAVSKIENSIGVEIDIQNGIYSVLGIDESAGGDVDHSIDTTFSIGEINQLDEDE